MVLLPLERAYTFFIKIKLKLWEKNVEPLENNIHYDI